MCLGVVMDDQGVWRKAYVALGSNQGKRLKSLQRALKALDQNAFCHLQALSSVWYSLPVDCESPSRNFLNMVASVKTPLGPEDLLQFFLTIETSMGRVRKERRNTSRPIDLDLLIYEDLELETATLSLPHPELAKRDFVLHPFAEIAPSLIHPSLGLSIMQLAENLPEEGSIVGRRAVFSPGPKNMSETTGENLFVS